MNNPNPFVPKGSLLEQQSKRRSGFKIGVFCVLAIGICGLTAMLIQGCKREESDNMGGDNSQPPVDTNQVAATDTNQPTMEASNPPVAPTPGSAQSGPPAAPAPAPVTEPAPAPAPTENEYVVVKGDTLAKIAKANGVSWKAIEDANPGVTPTRLKIGQKLIIPAGANSTAAPGATSADNGSGEVYTIKTGDTLSKIAKHYGVSIKAIEEANNLSSTKIYVGKKLTIPAAAPAPTPEATPAPAPAPANPPPAQNPPANQ